MKITLIVTDNDTEVELTQHGVKKGPYFKNSIITAELDPDDRFDVYWEIREFILQHYVSSQEHYDLVNGDDFHDG